MGAPCGEEIGCDHGAELGVVMGERPVWVFETHEFINVVCAEFYESGELGFQIAGLVVTGDGPALWIDWGPVFGGVVEG